MAYHRKLIFVYIYCKNFVPMFISYIASVNSLTYWYHTSQLQNKDAIKQYFTTRICFDTLELKYLSVREKYKQRSRKHRNSYFGVNSSLNISRSASISSKSKNHLFDEDKSSKKGRAAALTTSIIYMRSPQPVNSTKHVENTEVRDQNLSANEDSYCVAASIEENKIEGTQAGPLNTERQDDSNEHDYDEVASERDSEISKEEEREEMPIKISLSDEIQNTKLKNNPETIEEQRDDQNDVMIPNDPENTGSVSFDSATLKDSAESTDVMPRSDSQQHIVTTDAIIYSAPKNHSLTHSSNKSQNDHEDNISVLTILEPEKIYSDLMVLTHDLTLFAIKMLSNFAKCDLEYNIVDICNSVHKKFKAMENVGIPIKKYIVDMYKAPRYFYNHIGMIMMELLEHDQLFEKVTRVVENDCIYKIKSKHGHKIRGFFSRIKSKSRSTDKRLIGLHADPSHLICDALIEPLNNGSREFDMGTLYNALQSTVAPDIRDTIYVFQHINYFNLCIDFLPSVDGKSCQYILHETAAELANTLSGIKGSIITLQDECKKTIDKLLIPFYCITVDDEECLLYLKRHLDFYVCDKKLRKGLMNIYKEKFAEYSKLEKDDICMQ